MKTKLSVSGQISKTTLEGLTHIANALNSNDFQSAMIFYNNLVVASTFTETAAFLPAIKQMIHMAQSQRT